MTDYRCAPLRTGQGHATARRARSALLPRRLLRAVAGVVLLVAGASLALPARAQSSTVNGTVALSSQLVDRGQAITRRTPVLQGAVSWTLPAGWSLGLSAGTEVRSPGRVVEALAQASRHWSLSDDWQMQAGLLYYRYPGSRRSRAYDRAETGLDWTYRDVLSLGLSAIYLFGTRQHQPRGAADLNLHWPLTRQLSLSAGAGVAQTLAQPYRRYRYGYDYPVRSKSRNELYGYGHLGLLWDHGPWRVEFDRLLGDRATRRQWDAMDASAWVATLSRSY